MQFPDYQISQFPNSQVAGGESVKPTRAWKLGLWVVALVVGYVQAAAGQQTAGQPPAEPTKVDIGFGGLTVSSGVNSLTIGARAQFRWTIDDREEFDGDLAGAGLGRADGTTSQFDVPRLRVTLSGGVFRPWMRYLFQFDFSRTSGEGDSKIKDAILEIRPVDRPYRFQMGQFKVPFGLQQLTSSGRQQFVDRAITDNKFVPARDMGAMFAGTLASRKVGYEVGVFNGSGESRVQANASQLWAARVSFQPFGAYALSEGAMESGDQSIVHVGLGVRGGEQIRGRTSTTIVEEADNQTAVDLEFAARLPRFFSTLEYFWMIDELTNPVEADDIDSRGFHAQAGFMVTQPVEVGFRYARIEGDTDVDDAAVNEWRGVVGYFWRAHNLKLQGDAGQVSYGENFALMPSRARSGLPSLGTRLSVGESLSDTQVRIQFQLAF